MGMYTEFHFNAELKKDVPYSVIKILKYMLRETEETPELPDHPLFSTDRWDFMLRCDSYYFAAITHSVLEYDAIAEHWFLSIQSNFKNYDNEIEKFVDWIMPYLEHGEGEFLGFSRYEECENPDLIFMKDLGV